MTHLIDKACAFPRSIGCYFTIETLWSLLISPNQNTMETVSQNYRDNNNDIAHHHFMFEVLVTAYEKGFLVAAKR